MNAEPFQHVYTRDIRITRMDTSVIAISERISVRATLSVTAAMPDGHCSRMIHFAITSMQQEVYMRLKHCYLNNMMFFPQF